MPPRQTLSLLQTHTKPLCGAGATPTPTRHSPPTPLDQGCQNLDCAPDWLWQELKNPLYVRPCSPVQGEVGENKKKMLAGQIQPQAQSSTRPATSAKLLHRTEPVSPQCRNCKLPGRLQAWIQRAQSKSPLSRPGQVPPGPHKAAICVGRLQGEGIRCPAHPGALGLVHVVPTHSESPRSAPAVPARASESVGA